MGQLMWTVFSAVNKDKQGPSESYIQDIQNMTSCWKTEHEFTNQNITFDNEKEMFQLGAFITDANYRMPT